MTPIITSRASMLSAIQQRRASIVARDRANRVDAVEINRLTRVLEAEDEAQRSLAELDAPAVLRIDRREA